VGIGGLKVLNSEGGEWVMHFRGQDMYLPQLGILVDFGTDFRLEEGPEKKRKFAQANYRLLIYKVFGGTRKESCSHPLVWMKVGGESGLDTSYD
jgi:hypothetical protein